MDASVPDVSASRLYNHGRHRDLTSPRTWKPMYRLPFNAEAQPRSYPIPE